MTPEFKALMKFMLFFIPCVLSLLILGTVALIVFIPTLGQSWKLFLRYVDWLPSQNM